MQAFLAALVGGLLTIAGGLTAVLVTGRGVRSQWRRDTQLKVGTEVLSALQKRVSSINDLAYLADKKGDEGKKAWDVECAAATECNNARHAALLVSPPKGAALLQGIDVSRSRYTWPPAHRRSTAACDRLARLLATLIGPVLAQPAGDLAASR